MYAQKESRRTAHLAAPPLDGEVAIGGQAAKVSQWPQPTSGTS
jgi:hypothetical protein